MAKKFSITNFILASLLIVLGLVFSFANFALINSSDRFVGFVNAIELGNDIGKNQRAIYNMESDNDISNSNKEQTTKLVLQSLDMVGANVVQISFNNNDQLVVDSKYQDTISSYLTSLANKKTLIMRVEESAEKTADDVVVDGIKSLQITSGAVDADNTTGYGVYVKFNNKDMVANITKKASNKDQTIYFYDTEGNLVGKNATFTSKVTYGAMFIPSTDAKTDYALNEFAMQVIMGTNDIDLKLVDNFETTATSGQYAATYTLISLCVVLIAFAIGMIIKYRHLGLISLLINGFNITVISFLMQSLPIMTLTLSGVVALFVVLAISIYIQILYYENIKKQLKLGKRMPLAFKTAHKNSIMPIVDICVVALISAAVMYFINAPILKSFGVMLGIGGAVLLVSMCLLREFTKWYLHINSKNKAKIGYVKEAKGE